MTHPWHDISPGENTPKEVNVVVEVPKDSRVKYELDKDTGLITLDRVLYSALHYPGDYGFIPQSYWYDEDPMDVIVLSHIPVYPGTLVNVRVIGAFEMVDDDDQDDKIVAVHTEDPRFDNIHTLNDVPQHILSEIQHFFETYKQLEDKPVSIGEWKEKDGGCQYVIDSIALYSQTFHSTAKQ